MVFCLQPLRTLLRASLKLVFGLALGVYVVAALAYLGVRYWALPQIDTWRPLLLQQISRHLGMEAGQLAVGHIALDWHRADPVFVLDAVQWQDGRGQRVLHLPTVRGRLSWHGLLRGQLWFQELELDGLELALHRDVSGRIRVLGQSVDAQAVWVAAQQSAPADTHPPRPMLDHPALYWLGQQKRVVLKNATLTWTDAMRGGRQDAPVPDQPGAEKKPLPVLTLHPVTLVWLHEDGRYRLALSGQPDTHLGGPFQLNGEFVHKAAPAVAHAPDLADPKNWDARVYVSVRDLRAENWHHWLDLPQALAAQALSAQGWLTVQQGEVAHMTLHTDLTQGRWQGTGGVIHAGVANEACADDCASLSVAAAQVRMQGSGQAYRAALAQWLGRTRAHTVHTSAAPLDIQVTLQNLRLHLPALFGQPLRFDDVSARAQLGQPELTRPELTLPELTLMRVQARNADLDLTFSGRWQPHARSRAGWAALQGVLTRANMAALVSYFPLTVSAEARDWMRTGLLGGQIREAPFWLQGELDRFPFAHENSTAPAAAGGQWRLDGRYENALIDYAPPAAGMAGWPRLEQMHGQLAMRNSDLRMTAERAHIVPTDGHTVALTNVQAHIPDLMHDATLHLRSDSAAPAAAYLALVRNSPTARWLGGLFDAARADGHWRVPLRLSVPLMHSADTRARGQVQFQHGIFTLFDHLPGFEDVSGTLDFSEWSVSTQALRARFLGGEVQVSGGLGTGQNGLELAGRATLPALKEAWSLHQPLRPLDGAFDYAFLVEHLGKNSPPGTAQGAARPGLYRFSAHSDLVGITSTLPAPLGKAAATRWPMQFSWSPQPHGATVVDIRIADGVDTPDITLLAAQLVRGNPTSDDQNAPHAPTLGGFSRAAIRIGPAAELPALPASGLALALHHAGTLDLSAWLASGLASGLTSGLTSGQTMGAQAAPASTPAPAQPTAAFLPIPVHLSLHADHLHAGGLRLDAASINARYEPARSLRLEMASAQTAGTVLWAADTHTVQAHFSRLALEALQDRDADHHTANARVATAEADLFPSELDLPDVALTAENFSAFGYPLGRLSLHGRAVDRGRLWQLDRVELVSPSARLHGQGQWRLRNIGLHDNASPAPRGLALQAELASDNVGHALRELGLGDVMQGGAGTLSAQIFWADLPWRVNLPGLSGTVRLDLRRGRLSSIRSRSAKLLELLSAQSLQRLLNFGVYPGEFFASGFPFDRWTGTLHLYPDGIQTNDYHIEGAVGSIHLAGDMGWETGALDLQAMVVPRLDLSGASLATGFLVNPLVGMGAMLTQWLLRAPLSRAMTLRYTVKGNWQDPQIQEASVPGTGTDAHENPAAQAPPDAYWRY